MLDINIDNGIVYSTFERDPFSGRNDKKYFLKNKTFNENNITTFPIKYENGYVHSYNQDGMKLCHTDSNRTQSLFEKMTDNIYFNSIKSNDISKHHINTTFPIIFNNKLGLMDINNNFFNVSNIEENDFINSKMCAVGINIFTLFLCKSHFYIVKNNFDIVVKVSTDNELSDIDFGRVTDNTFSLMVKDNFRTGIFTYDNSIALQDKVFYNISYETTIDENNTLYCVNLGEFLIIKEETRHYYKANKELPSKIVYYNDKIHLVDERISIEIDKTAGSKFTNNGIFFNRNLYDINSYKTYNLNNERIVSNSNLSNIHKIEVEKSLYY